MNALTAPPSEVRAAASKVLSSAGATCVDYPHSLKCTAPVSVIESFFNTKVSAYAHTSRKNARVLRVAPTSPYTFPEEARTAGVKFFTNLVDFPTIKRKLGKVATNGSLRSKAAGDLSVMPESLDSFYGKATGSLASSQAPAEFQNDASYNPKDLELFATAAGRTLWNVSHKVGPYSPSQPDLEASLDEQYMGAVGTGNDNWYWTEVDWQYEFVEAIAKAPDSALPSVFSISWGWSESDR